VETSPIDGAFGVYVNNVDLAKDVDDFSAEKLRSLLLKHRLLVFRDQKLDAESLRDLGRHLGTLDVHPFIEALPGMPEVIAVVKEADEKQNFGGGWHSEVSFYEKPAMGTMLYAVETPDEGGDTLLADCVLAYDALSNETKDEIKDLVALHSAEHVYGKGGIYEKRATGKVSGTQTANMDAAEGQVGHPMVRTIPETGEKVLYVNLAFTVGIEGRETDEARPFLNELTKHAVDDAFVTRLKWKPGTLAVWDNRSTQHYALNDYEGQRREMLRVVIAGERPV
jgi:taurine dioxygenase